MFNVCVTEKNYSETTVQKAYNEGFEKAGRLFKAELVRALTISSRSGRTYLYRGKRYTAAELGQVTDESFINRADLVGYHTGHLSVTFGISSGVGNDLENGTIEMNPSMQVKIIGQTFAVNGMRLVSQSLGRAFV